MYRICFISLSLLFFSRTLYSQQWSTDEWDSANTALSVEGISQIEKDVILYVNLARMYPKKFVEVELKQYMGSVRHGQNLKNSKYRTSLIVHLNAMKPTTALYFDSLMYADAKCLALEQSSSGKTGHKRKKCKSHRMAECCSYGMNNGREIALQLLIDEDVPSLGHRWICLDRAYSKIGVSYFLHKKYEYGAVLDYY